MPRKETISVYKFDELGPRAREKARDWYREASAGDEWWETTYEDAGQVGIKIESFDLRGQIELSFKKRFTEVARLIIENHGEGEDTRKVALTFLADRRRNRDEAEQRFKEAIGRAYLNNLEKELEYQSSDEHVDETIRANDYDFYQSGERCTEFGG